TCTRRAGWPGVVWASSTHWARWVGGVRAHPGTLHVGPGVLFGPHAVTWHGGPGPPGVVGRSPTSSEGLGSRSRVPVRRRGGVVAGRGRPAPPHRGRGPDPSRPHGPGGDGPGRPGPGSTGRSGHHRASATDDGPH